MTNNFKNWYFKEDLAFFANSFIYFKSDLFIFLLYYYVAI